MFRYKGGHSDNISNDVHILLDKRLYLAYDIKESLSLYNISFKVSSTWFGWYLDGWSALLSVV